MNTRDSYHFDDEEVEDGRTVRTPMLIMDGNRVNLTDTVRFDDHGPHFVRATDEAVRDARQACPRCPRAND
jgi:hypothetical protein